MQRPPEGAAAPSGPSLRYGPKLSKFTLYATRQRFYLVGKEKVSGVHIGGLDPEHLVGVHLPRSYLPPRSQPAEVTIEEDEVGYTKEQMNELLQMINEANRNIGGLKKMNKFFGVLGFIRFLQGYHMVIITKRKKVGFIAGHFVYTVEDIEYVPVSNRAWQEPSATLASNDSRYKELAILADMSSCFFSYTYDITHTLQHNCKRAAPGTAPGWHDRFVWNRFLLQPVLDAKVGLCWVLPVVHGYFNQVMCALQEKPTTIALLARRSRHYAGVRFLKRGINDEGNVANEVETEQIVQCMHQGQVNTAACMSSFVQMRGSIPLFWGQDSQSMVPKPPINLVRADPFYNSSVTHFANLFERYGKPIMVLNLVKSIEKVPRETILKEEFERCLTLLNDSLPPENRIIYIPWDFLRAQKQKFDDPVALLSAIAEAALVKTGVFVQTARAYSTDSQSHAWKDQRGVVRTNCVDSLDRTNAAQFCIGKAALVRQLTEMGLARRVAGAAQLDEELHLLLVDMYEDLGNHVAMQYGGSELAHTMKNFESKTWASGLRDSSRELLTGMKRYYSNSFTDADKQASMNLLLGVFVPWREVEELWSLETDYLLHNRAPPVSSSPLVSSHWWEAALRSFEAHARAHRSGCSDSDAFEEYYSLGKLTSFDKLLKNTSYMLPSRGGAEKRVDGPGSSQLLRPRFSNLTSSSSRLPLKKPAAPAPQPLDPRAQLEEEGKLKKKRLFYQRYFNPGTYMPHRLVSAASLTIYAAHASSFVRPPSVPPASSELYDRTIRVAHPASTTGPLRVPPTDDLRSSLFGD